METNEMSGEWTLLNQDEAAADGKAEPPPLAPEGDSTAKEEALPEDKSGSDGSDIAVIDDEEDEGHLGDMESSLLSQDSSFSFLSASELSREGVEVLHEDLSDQASTIQEGLNSDVDLKPSVKHYVHTRNTHLNTILNVAVVLTITAVIGLGIGNFIGWSKQHQKHTLLSRSQVLKLKQLQDELVLCMKQQQLASGDEQESKVCYRDSEYWKQQFEALFEENQDLKGMLQQVKGESQAPLQCSSDATEEFHKLKLDLIVKQMEHLEVLKNLEEIKYQNMQSKERLKELEEENTELKAKLEEEEQDDQILVAGLEQKMEELKQENQELKVKLEEEMQDDVLLADLESKVHHLTDENRDLKKVLEDIRRQVLETSASPEPPVSKADSLKQQVNDIVAENEDLKTTIARIRYGSPGDQHKKQITHLVEENEGLKHEIDRFRNRPDFVPMPSNDRKNEEISFLQEHIKSLQEFLQQDKLAADQWKKLYEDIRQQMDNKKDGSNWSDLNWADILKKGLQNGTKALTDIVDSIVHFVSRSNNTLKKDIFLHLNASKGIFEVFQQTLINKWKELKSFTKPEKMQKYADQTRKTIDKMSEALENTMRKLHQAGQNFVTSANGKQSKADRLANKVWKIVDNLEQKWTTLKDKWNKKVTKSTQPQGPPTQGKNKEDNGKSKWYFRRARAREGLHARLHKDDRDSDWVFKRAQAREQSHMSRESRLYQDWYTRRGKGRTKNRLEKQVVDDDSDDSSCDDDSEKCETYEYDTWKKDSLLKKSGSEHFEKELFSHHDKMYHGDS